MADAIKCPHCGADGPDCDIWFETEMPRGGDSLWCCEGCGEHYFIEHLVTIEHRVVPSKIEPSAKQR